MQKKILFVHGMFQNSVSWARWVSFYEQRGFTCRAPDWPCHDGEPADLRANIPTALGTLTLDTVVEAFAAECQDSLDHPIVIGHSVGGLIAQILAARGLASAAVCISSVAPNDIIAADWHLLKNVASITNPLKGHDPYIMTPEGFHENFCNTMSVEESNKAYAATATHDSRQVLRDCLGKTGHIDLAAPHVPLLFISGDSDHIIPPALNRRNCEHYKHKGSIAEQVEFPKRGHFICGQPDWAQVAAFSRDWLLSRISELSVSGTLA
ncbi:MAG TPA: alpha/beta hydrolase [Opitutaceae bacterium]|jgi:pimeloyl-ACP methyl ester carboxylesterase|nr:alpha/beta hydrolase [Opitutaceae bacterium]